MNELYEIIISIRKKWWDLIKSGEKTLELRKTVPKRLLLLVGNSTVNVKKTAVVWEIKNPFVCLVYVPEEKSICGRFSCSGIEALDGENVEERSRVPFEEQERYRQQGAGRLFGWRIDVTEEFKEKKPLSVYGMKRPPQSWQYHDFIMW